MIAILHTRGTGKLPSNNREGTLYSLRLAAIKITITYLYILATCVKIGAGASVGASAARAQNCEVQGLSYMSKEICP